MKLIEQYLKSIGYALPLGKRADITRELRSLLLDEIESRYGADPSEADVRAAITAFGPPAEVASRYRNGQALIAEGLRDIYVLVLKVVLGALSIAFSVVFVVELATDPVGGIDLFWRILDIPMSIFAGWVSAIGVITLIFMGITRFFGDRLDGIAGEDWTVDELKDVELEEDLGSWLGTVIGLGIGGAATLLIVVYPQILSDLERAFEASGIRLGHTIRVSELSPWLWGIAALWLAEAASGITAIRLGQRTPAIRTADAIISAAHVLVFGTMVLSGSLYIEASGALIPPFTMAAPSWVGVRLIFLIVTVVSAAELVAWGVKRVSRSLL